MGRTEKPPVAQMPDCQCWCLKARKADAGVFFRELARLFPAGGAVYLEGPASREVREFLSSHPAPNPSQVQKGTLWPREKIFHIPLDTDVMNDLAQMAERRAEPELCSHLVVYEGGTVLLSAYDFLEEVRIADTVQEARVAEFALALGCEYGKVDT